MSNYRKTMADALREMYPLTEETQLDEGVFDPKDGEKWAKEIQKGIKAPVVDVKTSSLGGEESMSIMVKFSMEKEASKGGTAFFNSRYANVRVDIDGSMEMFQASHKFGIKKMRKAKIKSTKDVIKKINDWIVKVPSLKEEVDLDEFTKKDFDSNEDQNMHTENAVELARKFGTSKEYDQMVAIYKAHRKKGEISRSDQMKRDALVKKYLPKLKEEVEIDEAIPKSTMYALVIDGKVVAKGSKSDMMRKKKKEGGTVYNTPGSKIGDKIKEEVDLDEAIKVGDNVKVKLSRKGREYIEKGKVTEIEKDSIIVKHDFSRTPSKVKMTDIVKEEADLDEGKSDFEVKYAKSKGGPIKVTKFVQYDQARKFLHNLKKDGMNGIISKDGKPVKEEADLDENRMSQLHQMIKDKKSAEEIAKEMKLDVKTVKALMNSHHPEDVDESAASDARRAMSKDKDLRRGKDSADVDDNASDDDIKGASKNIMMQMRKAQSLSGRFDVEFADKKKVKIPAKMAIAVQQKYNAMKKPADKEKFQARIGKSYKDMLSALKEELQPKKESILERMNRKIKENKDG